VDLEPSGWLGKAADYAWGLAVVIGGVVVAMLRKQSTLEARIAALEDHHIERTRQLSVIDRKIDENQHLLLGSIDKSRDDLRADLRMIVSKLLDKVPTA
jgi:hypothetical protein